MNGLRFYGNSSKLDHFKIFNKYSQWIIMAKNRISHHDMLFKSKKSLF